MQPRERHDAIWACERHQRMHSPPLVGAKRRSRFAGLQGIFNSLLTLSAAPAPVKIRMFNLNPPCILRNNRSAIFFFKSRIRSKVRLGRVSIKRGALFSGQLKSPQMNARSVINVNILASLLYFCQELSMSKSISGFGACKNLTKKTNAC